MPKLLAVIVVTLACAWVGSVAGQEGDAVQVEVVAEVVIEEGNLDVAREEALSEAKKRCIAKVLSSHILSVAEYRRNAFQLRTLFIEKPDPYIAHEIIEEEAVIDDGAKYQVRLSALVRADAIRVGLLESGITGFTPSGPRPSIMVLMQERFDTRVSGTGLTTSEITSVLTERGIKVVDPEQKQLIDLRSLLMHQGSSEASKAVQAAAGFKSDYLLLGKAVVTSSGPLAGTDLKAWYANVSASLIESSSGTVIVAKNATAKARHIDELSGGNWALEEAGRKIAKSLADVLEQRLIEELRSGTEIVIEIHGLESSSEMMAVEDVLSAAERVEAAHRRFFFGGAGQLEVRFGGTSSQLAAMLVNAQIGEQPFEIVEVLPRYLRIQRTTPAFTPDGDIRDLMRQYLEQKYKRLDIEKARESDRELAEKIALLQESRQLSDQQKKQLYAAQEAVEQKRKEAFYREQELEKRTQELATAQARSQRLSRMYNRVSEELQELRSASRSSETERQSQGVQAETGREAESHARSAAREPRRQAEEAYEATKNELERLREETNRAMQDVYTATRNRSNAEQNRAASVVGWVDEGIKLYNLFEQIRKVIS